MKYMLLIYDVESAIPDMHSPEGQEEFGAWMRVSEEMGPVTEAGAPLLPTQTATTVRVRDGETVLSDGPFAETKEALGGYYVIDVPDIDAAAEWAAKLPNVGRGSVEIRPVMELPTA